MECQAKRHEWSQPPLLKRRYIRIINIIVFQELSLLVNISSHDEINKRIEGMSMRDTSAALSFVPHLPQHLEYDEVLFAFYFPIRHKRENIFVIIERKKGEKIRLTLIFLQKNKPQV